MEFTFGIITTPNTQGFLYDIIKAIHREVPKHALEIIVVGGNFIDYEDVKHIPFDENAKPAWITKKKNLVTENATKENIVFLHDYVCPLPGWYQGQLKSGNDFDIRMDKIINLDGSRFRDWTIWPHNDNEVDNIVARECLIPYDVSELTKYMYISGTYWIAKKYVMAQHPLNEELCWGEGEDVQWSKKVRESYRYKMNINSAVQILKAGKDRVFSEIRQSTLEKILQYAKNNPL